MVSFHPFRGLLPELEKGEHIEDRVSPPYDVIGPSELKQLQSLPYNVTRITLGGVDGYYDQAGELLNGWIAHDMLVKDKEECYYLYEQQFVEDSIIMTRIGLVGVLAATGYSPDGVVPHEETFSKVKEDRLNLLRGTETHCESIFGLFDDYPSGMEGRIQAKAERLFSFSEPSGVVHSLHRISDPDMVQEIQGMFAKKRVLIADGHHRYETACRYAQENRRKKRKGFVLATMVASTDPGLVVKPTHRLVGGVSLDQEELLKALGHNFALSKCESMDDLLVRMRDSSGENLGLVTKEGMFVLLKPKQMGKSPLERLDTYLCEELIMKPLFLSRQGVKVAYDHDESSVRSRLLAQEFDLAILLNTPPLEIIWEVALQGGKMPKKSTYFWPKMWSGLVYYQMK